jgi:hypothetical protein
MDDPVTIVTGCQARGITCFISWAMKPIPRFPSDLQLKVTGFRRINLSSEWSMDTAFSFRCKSLGFVFVTAPLLEYTVDAKDKLTGHRFKLATRSTLKIMIADERKEIIRNLVN